MTPPGWDLFVQRMDKSKIRLGPPRSLELERNFSDLTEFETVDRLFLLRQRRMKCDRARLQDTQWKSHNRGIRQILFGVASVRGLNMHATLMPVDALNRHTPEQGRAVLLRGRNQMINERGIAFSEPHLCRSLHLLSGILCLSQSMRAELISSCCVKSFRESEHQSMRFL